jgi:hypothetical protein
LINHPFKKVRELGVEQTLGSGGVITTLFPIVMDDSPRLQSGFRYPTTFMVKLRQMAIAAFDSR